MSSMMEFRSGEMEYSVLMSVYYKENPTFLRQSMNSIFAQTKRQMILS